MYLQKNQLTSWVFATQTLLSLAKSHSPIDFFPLICFSRCRWRRWWEERESWGSRELRRCPRRRSPRRGQGLVKAGSCMHNPLFVHTSALTWICVPSPSSCRYLLFKKRILQLLLLYYYNNNIIFPPCYEKKSKKISKKKKLMKKWQKISDKTTKTKKKTKQSLRGIVKFQYYLHQNVHNRHDFYFIVSPIVSSITSIITSKTKQTKKEGKKKQSLLLSQFTNKLSIVLSRPL